MRILLTGGGGFIGQNIFPILNKDHDVLAPSRNEFDVENQHNVDTYLADVQPDCLVHCAIADPSKPVHAGKSVLQTMLLSFMNLLRYPFKRIIYIGSGAEYDKSSDISYVREEDDGIRVPTDEYGLARYIMSRLTEKAAHIYNLRVFGCYGPHEPLRRFIHHAIDCCIKNEPISIRKDCRFSYVFVEDLGRIISQISTEKEPPSHIYNVTDGKVYPLSELARQVQNLMGKNGPITLLSPGWANEYTASNERFVTDFPDFVFTPISEGIAREISWKLSECSNL